VWEGVALRARAPAAAASGERARAACACACGCVKRAELGPRPPCTAAGRAGNVGLGAGCWLLVAGCWLLVAGCWLLGAWCRVLVAVAHWPTGWPRPSSPGPRERAGVLRSARPPVDARLVLADAAVAAVVLAYVGELHYAAVEDLVSEEPFGGEGCRVRAGVWLQRLLGLLRRLLLQLQLQDPGAARQAGRACKRQGRTPRHPGAPPGGDRVGVRKQRLLHLPVALQRGGAQQRCKGRRWRWRWAWRRTCSQVLTTGKTYPRRRPRPARPRRRAPAAAGPGRRPAPGRRARATCPAPRAARQSPASGGEGRPVVMRRAGGPLAGHGPPPSAAADRAVAAGAPGRGGVGGAGAPRERLALHDLLAAGPRTVRPAGRACLEVLLELGGRPGLGRRHGGVRRRRGCGLLQELRGADGGARQLAERGHGAADHRPLQQAVRQGRLEQAPEHHLPAEPRAGRLSSGVS
jgi:hypothetical protein